MNEPLAMEWLEAVKRTGRACDIRVTPYAEKAARGELKVSDVTAVDAVWILGIAKDAPGRDVLKGIAKGSPAAAFIS